MDTPTVDYVATISPSSYTESELLADAIEALRADRAVRCVVLDLTTARSPALDDRTFHSVLSCPLPIVCALSGVVEGSALGLALVADIRVCDSTASVRGPAAFAAVERRLGLLCWDHAALAELQRGGLLDHEALFASGLVSAVTRPGQALAEAARIARVIASRGPLATQFGKEAVWRGLELPFGAALRFETDLTLLLQTTKDRAEGVAAFLQKRQPEFTGE